MSALKSIALEAKKGLILVKFSPNCLLAKLRTSGKIAKAMLAIKIRKNRRKRIFFIFKFIFTYQR
jgi:hypothetical protein